MCIRYGEISDSKHIIARWKAEENISYRIFPNSLIFFSYILYKAVKKVFGKMMDGKKVTLKHVKTSPYTFTIFIDKETLHIFKSVIIFSQDKVGKKWW